MESPRCSLENMGFLRRSSVLAVDLAQKHKELGEAPIGRLLWKFSMPGIVGMLVNSLYNIVDRIFIGNGVNSEAIGGLTVAFPLMIITMAVSMLVGVGASTLLSIRLGEHDHEAAEKLLGNGFILLIIFGLLPTVIGLPFLRPLLILFGATPDILSYAVDYTWVILIGNVGASVGFGMNNFVRAEGSPRMAMVTMLISALLNIVLDYIFIFPLGMGVAGAAWATIIAQAVSALWVLYFFTLFPGLDASLEKSLLSSGMAAVQTNRGHWSGALFDAALPKFGHLDHQPAGRRLCRRSIRPLHRHYRRDQQHHRDLHDAADGHFSRRPAHHRLQFRRQTV